MTDTSASTMSASTTLPTATLTPCEEERELNRSAFASGYDDAKKVRAEIDGLQAKLDSLLSGNSTSGNLPPDTLKMMADKTRDTIKSYLNEFVGTKESSDWSAVFEFRPKAYDFAGKRGGTQSSPALLRFDESAGICKTDESVRQGVLIHTDFEVKECPGSAESLWLEVLRDNENDGFMAHISAANQSLANKERGFYYRIPAKATVRLVKGTTAPHAAQAADVAARGNVQTQQADEAQNGAQYVNAQQRGNGGNGSNGGGNSSQERPRPNQQVAPPPPHQVTELSRQNMPIAQLGITTSIPASSAGRTTQYTIGFDEETGALKNFRLGSNALLEKSMIGEVEGAATDIIGAKQARDKAEKDEETAAAAAAAAAADVLTQKKRELDLLKTQNEINEEKKKLESPEEEEDDDTPR
jgi:hypothetical protein